MYIESFSKKYEGDLKDWLTARQHPLVGEYPEIGYIAFERGEPIAAAFIRRCEGGFGLIDGLVTNPSAPGDLRYSAIDFLVDKLHETSKQLKLKGLLTFSSDKNTLMRAKRFGYVELPQTLLCLDLSTL